MQELGEFQATRIVQLTVQELGVFQATRIVQLTVQEQGEFQATRIVQLTVQELGVFQATRIVQLTVQELGEFQATRIVQLTVQELGVFKYHASSCYRHFHRKMASFDIVTSHQEEPFQQEPSIHVSERCSKIFKPSIPSNVCIFCSADRITVRWKTIHTLYRVSEKLMAQKVLNAGILFRNHVYTVYTDTLLVVPPVRYPLNLQL